MIQLLNVKGYWFQIDVKMALRTLPLLYLNLGGEMLYVLDQRLTAQNISGPKSVKGMNCYITGAGINQIYTFKVVKKAN